jgi:hypothetical protein
MRILLLLLVTLPMLSMAATESFESARSEAMAMRKSDTSRDYLKNKFFPFYETQHSKTLHHCFSNVQSPSMEPFDLVIKISSTGTVEQTWVNTPTNISSCLNNAILASTFPAPPTSNFYVLFQMKFGS